MKHGGENLTAAFAELSDYRFKDATLLERALTHSSISAGRGTNYERLEFLGDRVLGLVICETLLARYPDATEGELARRLNHLVKRQTCTEVGKALGLSKLSRISDSLGPQQKKGNNKVLADILEAVIGAIYLDGGLEPAREFTLTAWQKSLENSIKITRDAKTALQEWALSLNLPLPAYHMLSRSGPDHGPEFQFEVHIEGYEPVSARAGSKRQAEQNAAQAFITKNELPLK